MRLAYLHGFASSPLSHKGVTLRERLSARGVRLELPDLNRPDFAHLTFSDALAAVDAWAGDSGEVGLIGSSMGGWVAARWAALHPERTPRLVLLCPGFDLPSRWPALFGADVFDAWARRGWHEFEGPGGVPLRLHWGFIEDAGRHEPIPEVPCPTVIVHGTRDEVVPVQGSRAYAAARPHVRLVEVDDDHGLVASIDVIEREVTSFLLG